MRNPCWLLIIVAALRAAPKRHRRAVNSVVNDEHRSARPPRRGVCVFSIEPHIRTGGRFVVLSSCTFSQQTGAMEQPEGYTEEEINALKGIFALYDPEKSGTIAASELEVCNRLIGSWRATGPQVYAAGCVRSRSWRRLGTRETPSKILSHTSQPMVRAMLR
jgi:hypothetical protein